MVDAPDVEPDALDVVLGLRRGRRQRVVRAQHLQEAAVAPRASVRGHDPVERPVALAPPREPDADDHACRRGGEGARAADAGEWGFGGRGRRSGGGAQVR